MIAVLQHSTGWAEGNNAPVMATPSSTSLKYLFPRGTATALSFPSDPATDPDGDTITYRFVFTVPDTSTVGDTIDTTEVEPSDALFSVSQSGNRFEFKGKTGTTPHQFNALYGDTATYSVPVKMYANDGTDDSAPLSFTIAAVYDASARFPSPATYRSDNRSAVSSTYETYEGPNAAGNIAITWHASEHSSNRAWSAGLAVGSPVWCRYGTDRPSPLFPVCGQDQTTTHPPMLGYSFPATAEAFPLRVSPPPAVGMKSRNTSNAPGKSLGRSHAGKSWNK